MAVVFFCHNLLSPIASIFGSGAPSAARTFLSCLFTPATEPEHCFQFAKLAKKSVMASIKYIKMKNYINVSILNECKFDIFRL